VKRGTVYSYIYAKASMYEGAVGSYIYAKASMYEGAVGSTCPPKLQRRRGQ